MIRSKVAKTVFNEALLKRFWLSSRFTRQSYPIQDTVFLLSGHEAPVIFDGCAYEDGFNCKISKIVCGDPR